MTIPGFEDWLAHGWGVQVETPDDLFTIIGRIALLAQHRTYAWRGQRDASWAFSASLFRELMEEGGAVTEERIRERELAILKEANRWSLGRDLGPSATDMHMLAILQHHGVPTRLFDVTANPMTALWFATEEHKPDGGSEPHRSPGVLFVIDVTDTAWYETFEYVTQTYNHLQNPLAAGYENALTKSAEAGQMFRVFSALPDERMKAQEGFFLGSTVPERHNAPGILGLNPLGPAPGDETLGRLLSVGNSPGCKIDLPFCAIVIPDAVKSELRNPLKHTFNRRRRVLFPDVDGFREGYVRKQLD